MKRKKAQIQMGESIAIIIILLIIMIFGFVFYSKIKALDINDKKILYEEIDIVKLSQIVYSFPEIQCSFAEVTDYGCIDKLKLNFLAKMINSSFEGSDKNTYFYYRKLFGRSTIKVEFIDESEFILYKANESWNSKTNMYMPIIVYNPLTDSNNFGVLTIEKYN